jgi:hypothetical protein
MKTWYSKTVPYPATDTNKKIDDAFRALCLAQGGRANGAAVFSTFDQATRSTTLYFSPEARRVAEQSEAQSCHKPDPLHGFALSIGDPDSWAIHFPALARLASQTSLRPAPAAPVRKR